MTIALFAELTRQNQAAVSQEPPVPSSSNCLSLAKTVSGMWWPSVRSRLVMGSNWWAMVMVGRQETHPLAVLDTTSRVSDAQQPDSLRKTSL